MEREASSWGLEPGDVHSPDETGSPEGSLKGEGRTAPPECTRKQGCSLWEENKAGSTDTWEWGWGRRLGVPGLCRGGGKFQHLDLGPATLLGVWGREVYGSNGPNDLPDPPINLFSIIL